MWCWKRLLSFEELKTVPRVIVHNWSIRSVVVALRKATPPTVARSCCFSCISLHKGTYDAVCHVTKRVVALLIHAFVLNLMTLHVVLRPFQSTSRAANPSTVEPYHLLNFVFESDNATKARSKNNIGTSWRNISVYFAAFFWFLKPNYVISQIPFLHPRA